MLLMDVIVSLFGIGTPMVVPQPDPSVNLTAEQEPRVETAGRQDVADVLADPWPALLMRHRLENPAQVRIEQRVIVRITPRPADARRRLSADTAQVRLTSRSADGCVPLDAIAGVSARQSHLLLFLRDRRLLTARMEKSCSVEEFYSGFYLERPEDGQMCVDRDALQARSGARCTVAEFRQLVRTDPQ